MGASAVHGDSLKNSKISKRWLMAQKRAEIVGADFSLFNYTFILTQRRETRKIQTGRRRKLKQPIIPPINNGGEHFYVSPCFPLFVLFLTNLDDTSHTTFCTVFLGNASQLRFHVQEISFSMPCWWVQSIRSPCVLYLLTSLLLGVFIDL